MCYTIQEKKEIIINKVLIPAIQRLYRVDYISIEIGVSERNICARLALHMENIMREYDRTNNSGIFEKYYAEVEYNKMADGETKTYESSDRHPINMVSDLLIHNRGDERNYLPVEMKRKGNYHHVKEDRCRLISMVSPRPNNETKLCVHDTLVGAFIVYDKSGVSIQLFEHVNGVGQKTDSLDISLDGLMTVNPKFTFY